MKIVGTVVEYNPLHLGHLKHIEYIKNTLKADKIIAVMSGNFSQRGEPTVLDKFTRAKNAVIAGVDMVIELPVVYATANAETFAYGAVSLLNSLGVIDSLCFGVESGTREDYLALAKNMNNESKEFKKCLKEHLSSGVSLAKAKFLTLKDLGIEGLNENLISSPNNILGLEYTKAILKLKSEMEIEPMIRVNSHNDKTLKKGITSATSIREVIKTEKLKKVKKNVPKFVYSDLKPCADFDKIIMAKLITASCEDLKLLPDCTEGLENRIKALSKDNLSVNKLVEKVVTKRYTEPRIRRILIANLLGITQSFTDECKESELYAKVLAVSSKSKNLISEISSKAKIPVITRKSDLSLLKKTATNAFEKDVLANDLYNLASGSKANENLMIIV